jgi:uncharacterized protein
MKNLTAAICLTIVVLFGSVGCSNNLQKGLSAYNRGDYATALREWEPLAKQGNAGAQYNLGLMYRMGTGVIQDYKTAVKWYRLAAKQGLALAQYNLGWMYYKGRGVPQNNKTAVKWYRLAAKQGLTLAQYNLGWMYYKGRGVPQNNKTALKWYRLAAKQGYTLAQNGIGWMYANGTGVPQDYKTALKWYRLAAKQGLALAQTNYTDALKKQNVRKIRGERERLRETCSGFGFKDGSKEMSKCMFDLYKLEKSQSQTRAVIQNNTGAASARLEEQRRQRQLEGSLELMRRGVEMMSPSKNTTNQPTFPSPPKRYNCYSTGRGDGIFTQCK